MFVKAPITCLWLLSLLTTSALAEGESAAFVHQQLFPEGVPEVEVFDDFNGDGRNDILLCDDRHLSLFLNREGAFSSRPDQVLTAPEEAVFLDVGDVDGDGCREPIFLSRQGVTCIENTSGLSEDRVFRQVLEYPNSFLPPRVRKLVFLDFMRDITGNGFEDLVLPELKRYVFYQGQGQGAFERWGELAYQPKADFYTELLSHTGRLKEVIHVPHLLAGREQTTPMLVLFDGSQVRLYKKDPEGPMQFVAAESLYKEDPRAYQEASRAYFGKNAFFEDLDGDGSHTLVVADNREGKVEFLVPGPGDEPFTSGLTVQTGGWILKPVFSDLNKDGRKDLILPAIEKIGIFTILRIFFTSRFDIQYLIFFNRQNPIFRMVPDLSKRLSLPLNFSAGPEGLQVKHSLIYSFNGDFNGDGSNDFLVKSKPRELGFFFGRQDQGFSSQADQGLAFQPVPRCVSVTTRVNDFNGDGCSDIYLHQKSAEQGEERYDIYLSSR